MKRIEFFARPQVTFPLLLLLATNGMAQSVTTVELQAPPSNHNCNPDVYATGFSPDGHTLAGNLYPDGNGCGSYEGRFWVIGPDDTGIWRKNSGGRFRANANSHSFRANSGTLVQRKEDNLKEFRSQFVGIYKNFNKSPSGRPALWLAPGIDGATNEVGNRFPIDGDTPPISGELFGQSSKNYYFGKVDGMSAIISSVGLFDLNYPSFMGAYTGTEFGTGLFVGNKEGMSFGYRFRNGSPTRNFTNESTFGVYVDSLGNEPIVLAENLNFEDFGGFTAPGETEQENRFISTGAAASAADVATFDLELSSNFLEEFSAIAVGQRFDGMPGAWAIRRDGSVSNPRRTGVGDRTSNLGGTNGAGTNLGWIYQVNAVSSDGRLIVGTATLETGIPSIRSGGCGSNPNQVLAGTQIAVYWTVGEFLKKPAVGGAHPLGEVLRCGFAGNNTIIEMTDGLIEANDVFYDVENDVYVVSGRDQDGGAAIATLDL